jgi:hypothetical protein
VKSEKLRDTRVKRVREDLDHRLSRIKENRYHIEPARALGDVLPRQVILREARDPAALERRHGFRTVPELAPLPRLHFHEDQRWTVSRDDVNFSTPRAVAPGNYCVPAPFEFATREIFACFPEFYSGLRHARNEVQAARHISTHHEDTE